MRVFSSAFAAMLWTGAALAAEAPTVDATAPAMPLSAPASTTQQLAPSETDKLPKPTEVIRFVPSGEPGTIALSAVANPDCSSAGKTVARVLTKPAHGDITFDYKKVFTSFSARIYEHCNEVEIPGMATLYKSVPDFFGEDTADVLYIYPNGNAQQIHFVVEVK